MALGLPGLHADLEIERVAVTVDPLVSSYCEALGAALGEAGRGGRRVERPRGRVERRRGGRGGGGEAEGERGISTLAVNVVVQSAVAEVWWVEGEFSGLGFGI